MRPQSLLLSLIEFACSVTRASPLRRRPFDGPKIRKFFDFERFVRLHRQRRRPQNLVQFESIKWFALIERLKATRKWRNKNQKKNKNVLSFDTNHFASIKIDSFWIQIWIWICFSLSSIRFAVFHFANVILRSMLVLTWKWFVQRNDRFN